MIDAKQEIIDTVLGLVTKDKFLKGAGQSDILDIIQHLLEFQFKPNETKTKKFVDEKIREMAEHLVREEKRGD